MKEQFEKSMIGPNEITEEYMMAHKDRGKTIDNPKIISGRESQTIVGCICDKDSDVKVNWFLLEEGPVQQCNCGYYYKLVKSDTPTMYGEIMGYNEEEMVLWDHRRTVTGQVFGDFGGRIRAGDFTFPRIWELFEALRRSRPLKSPLHATERPT